MNGWIKIYREIQEHWIWQDEKHLKWWLTIILNVNHEPKKFSVGTELFVCDPGQSFRSIQQWTDAFNCSKKTTVKFFKMLENDGMISYKILGNGNRRKHLLTVMNWDKFQVMETEMFRERKPECSANGNPNVPSNKNIKNDKEYKKRLLSEITISEFSELNSEYLEAAKSFQLLFKKNLQEAGAATTVIEKAKGSWVDDIRLMIETDKYEIEDLRSVYRFLQKDAFWKQNILSTSILRKQMPKLKMKIRNGTGRNFNKEATSWDELAEVVAGAFNV